MRTVKLPALAKTIRSKNAGVNTITFDIIFPDRESFEFVKASGALTRQTIAALYNLAEEQITTFTLFEPALAIKFAIRRSAPAGGPGDSDIFGCQQYGPLFDVEIPLPAEAREDDDEA